MDRAKQYRANAEDAERRARRAATEGERRAYERIAQGWRDLLVQEERGEDRGPDDEWTA